MRRFYTEPENINNDKAIISEDSKHITKVLRMSVGDEVLVFDGNGYEYKARLSEINSDKCVADIISREISKQEPKVKVTIYQGLPKSDKMDDIIQKSVELGVYSIVPVRMDRCVMRLDNDKKTAEKLKRWNRISLEASKQCGRGIVPRVQEPVSFKELIDECEKSELVVMPYEMLGHNGVSNLKDVLVKNNAKEIGVIIGPEGGFSDSEAKLAESTNIKLVGLGNRILRTETVSSAMLAIIMYEKNEM